MSLADLTAARRPASPIPAPERPPGRRLHAVPPPAPRRRPRTGFAVVAFSGAVAIAVAQMALSVLTTEASYELAALSQERRTAILQAQELRDQVAGLSSPQNLASKAASLGMVIDASPSYLRLSDGAIVGEGEAAGSVSTVDAGKRAAVGNALLEEKPVAAASAGVATRVVSDVEAAAGRSAGAAAEKADTAVPPPITEGLPSPTTR